MKKVIVLFVLMALGAFSCYFASKNASKKSVRDIALENIEALAQETNEFVPHEKCVEKVIPDNTGFHFYECKKGTTENLFGLVQIN